MSKKHNSKNNSTVDLSISDIFIDKLTQNNQSKKDIYQKTL